ncbi:MAG TPA: septum formation initiator family protein [Hyphomicrobium sp.]|nr:septum formation initiator family protein [Hyphomicrobium sp.]
MLRSSFHVRRNNPKRRAAVLLRQVLVLLACLSATGYFAYHARYGRHGFEARAHLLDRSALLDFEIKSLESVRSKLARDVALLTPELPNADLVEEIARDVLGYVQPNDRIVQLR